MRKYLRFSLVTMLLSIVVCLCCIHYTVGHFSSKFGLSPRGVFYYTVRKETPPVSNSIYWTADTIGERKLP